MIVKDVFHEILPEIWPMIVIITVILVSLRLASIRGSKKLVIYKELIMLLFIIYILCLFHIVTFQDVNYGVSNFIPFKEIFRYDIGSAKFIKNFIPYGFFASYFLKNKKFVTIGILALIVSLTIEIVQLNIGRVFDIDDVILNVIGALFGYLLYVGLSAISSKLPKIFRSDAFLNILVIVIIVIMIIYGFNINIYNWYM